LLTCLSVANTMELAVSSIFWLEYTDIFILWNSLTGERNVLLEMLMYGNVLNYFQS
jgi:hypothetical protein